MKANRFLLSICLGLLLCQFSSNSFAQDAGFLMLNREQMIAAERMVIADSTNFHNSCRPFALAEIPAIQSLRPSPTKKTLAGIFEFGDFNKTASNWKVNLSPLLTFLPGYELEAGKTILETAIGASARLSFKSNWAADVSFVNTNSNFSENWNAYAQKNKVMPGNGYAYPSALGYTNAQVLGSLSYRPNEHFNFSAGRGKNFFGEGYRSLLLSDNASNYDYFKITSSIWKIKYINLFTSFKDVRNSAGIKSRYANKYATIHYLSWNATKRINLSFFESIIWQSRDSNNRNLGYDVNYLNPVIFYRPTEYSLGSSDNALIGANLKVRFFRKQILYAQVLIDEFLLKEIKARSGWWANKHGIQVGIKSYDLAKIDGLFFQLEWNSVRPYTYAHSNSLQNYGHFNESLAHPLGANFSEFFSTINYQKNNWMFDLKFSYAMTGLDSTGKNFGQNIYQSNINHYKEFGNTTGQGISTSIQTFQFTCSYLIHRANNIRIELSFIDRSFSNNFSKQHNAYVQFGIRTALWNQYRDF